MTSNSRLFLNHGGTEARRGFDFFPSPRLRVSVVIPSCLFLLLVACGQHSEHPGSPLSHLPATAGPLDALNRRHARLRSRMRHRGYGEEVGLTRALVLEESGVVLPLDLAAGHCSTFLGLGGGAIRDLNLTLYDGEGSEAATDSVEGEGALVHVCPQG